MNALYRVYEKPLDKHKELQFSTRSNSELVQKVS